MPLSEIPKPPSEAVSEAASISDAIMPMLSEAPAANEAPALRLAEADADSIAARVADSWASANRLSGSPPIAAESASETLGSIRLTPSVALMLTTADRSPSNWASDGSDRSNVGSDRLAAALI